MPTRRAQALDLQSLDLGGELARAFCKLDGLDDSEALFFRTLGSIGVIRFSLSELSRLYKRRQVQKQDQLTYIRSLGSLAVKNLEEMRVSVEDSIERLDQAGLFDIIDRNKKVLTAFLFSPAGKRVFLEAEAKAPGLDVQEARDILGEFQRNPKEVLARPSKELLRVDLGSLAAHFDLLAQFLQAAVHDDRPLSERILEKLDRFFELLAAIGSLISAFGFFAFDIRFGTKVKGGLGALLAALSIILAIFWVGFAVRRIILAIQKLIDP
jgi:hypothetical protein